MHQRLARSGEGEAVLRYAAADIAVLTVNQDGVVTGAVGPGLLRAGLRADLLVGQPVWPAISDQPELLHAARTALMGKPASGEAEAWGTTWRYDFQPTMGGGFVGMACAPAAEPEKPRVRIWEMAGAPPHEPDYWSGDRFSIIEGRPGVIMTRVVPEAELARLLTTYPQRMHFISDSRPPASRLRIVR